MPYGILKCDNITFDQGGADQNVTVSGIYRAITSGVTVTGTISGVTIIGTTTVSGATVTGTTVQGTTVQGVSGTFTSLTGTTTTGTTANFVSGVFTTRISGTTVTGDTGQFTSGTFVSLTGTTITGTTINAVTVSSTTGTFGSITGTTITGTTINGVTVNSTTGNFTSLTGVTVTGTTANFASGVFTTQVSGLTVTGTQSSFTSGNFVTLSGATATFTSGVIASGTATNPSLSIVGDGNTGIYSPGADQLAVATNGTGRLFINSTGLVGVGTSVPGSLLSVKTTGGADLFYVDDNTSKFYFSPNGSGEGIIKLDTANAIRFLNAGGERLRISSSGNVGIGTSSPTSQLSVKGAVTVGETVVASIFQSEGTANSSASLWFSAVGDSDSARGAKISAISNGNGAGNGHSLAFLTSANGAAPTERLRINSAGNVGIGTTSPDGRLHVLQGTTPNIAQLYVGQGGGSSNYYDANNHYFRDGNLNSVISTTSSTIQLFTSNTERARIDSSGRLLVGTSSARTNFNNSTGTAGFQVEGTSSASASISIVNNNTADADYPVLALSKSSTGAVGGNGIVANNEELGSIWWQGNDGSEFVVGAQISAAVDGTPGANDMPGRLVFSTTADGASSPTERMRITNGGAMLQGNTSDLTGVLGTGLKVKSNAVGSNFSAAALCLQGTGGDFYAVKFADQDMGVVSVTTGAVDYIEIGGSTTTATLFSNGLVRLPNVGSTASAANVFMDSAAGNQLARSTSSLRYKTDIEDLDTDRADAALSLRPVWYRSKATADRKDWSHYGLIAEEVAEIEPRLVNWTYLEDDYITVTNEYGIENKELKPDAKLVPDGVQYDRLPVLLLSVVQRQEKRIRQLEAEIATVKAQLS